MENKITLENTLKVIDEMEKEATNLDTHAKFQHPYKNGKLHTWTLVSQRSQRLVASYLRAFANKLKGEL